MCWGFRCHRQNPGAYMNKAKRMGRSLGEVLLLLICLGAGALLYRTAELHFYRAAYPIAYRDIVLTESERNALPPSLVFAVIHTESGFDPAARSHVGAQGLMQITPDTLDWTVYRLGEEKQPEALLYDSAANIKYGAALLRLLTNEFGQVENVLCAYHAGWGSVKSWLQNPEYAPNGTDVDLIPFGDTARYVEKVLATQEIYRKLYGLR